MSGALTWGRLSYRQQKWEILLLGIAVVGAIGVMLWMTSQLAGITAAYSECDVFTDEHLMPATCNQASQTFFQSYSNAEVFLRNGWLIGFVVGLIVGIPLVARDLEQGTVHMAWTLGQSRTRWLLGRVVFGALVVAALLVGLAVVTDVLGAAMQPNDDLGRSFHFEGNRGVIIVARGVLALGVGVLVGAIVGRQLPALLLGLIVTGLLYAAITFAIGRWNEMDAIESWYDQDHGAPLWVGSGVKLPSGERVSMMDFYGNGGEAFQAADGQLYASAADADAERDPIGQEYILVIPGERYPEIMARTSLVTAGVGVLLMVGAGVVTNRRRP